MQLNRSKYKGQQDFLQQNTQLSLYTEVELYLLSFLLILQNKIIYLLLLGEKLSLLMGKGNILLLRKKLLQVLLLGNLSLVILRLLINILIFLIQVILLLLLLKLQGKLKKLYQNLINFLKLKLIRKNLNAFINTIIYLNHYLLLNLYILLLLILTHKQEKLHLIKPKTNLYKQVVQKLFLVM